MPASKLGIDLDGCVTNFFKVYEDLHVKLAGVDLFPARWPDALPQDWNWPTTHGYEGRHTAAVWAHIKANPTFWKDIEPLPGAVDSLKQLNRLSKEGHQVFFITDRPGVNPKRQTEEWLYGTGFVDYPTVIVSANKPAVVHALDLDFMIDDKPETVTSLCELARTALPKLKGHFYTIGYPYNEKGRHPDAIVVSSVQEALEREGLWS